MQVKKLKQSGLALMQGNVACAEGALAADCKFFAGYPITPASEIAEHMSGRIFQEGGTFMQMEDELGSLNSLIGASWSGARSMSATSGPGLSLMQEALGNAIVTETPLVIVDVMRGGPSSGQATNAAQQDLMAARYGTHGDYELIALCPSSVQEMFDFTVRAFNLADEYRVPVIVLADEVIGHMREKLIVPETVEIFDDKFEGLCKECYRPDERLIPPRVRFFEGHSVLLDGQLHDERGIRAGHLPEVSARMVIRYCEKILTNIDRISDVKEFYADDMDIAVVCYGSTARSALSAVNRARSEGLKVGIMKVNTVWPFPEKQIITFCSRARKVVVPEMNYGQYVKEIARAVGKEKVIKFSQMGGVLPTPEKIYRALKEV